MGFGGRGQITEVEGRVKYLKWKGSGFKVQIRNGGGVKVPKLGRGQGQSTKIGKGAGSKYRVKLTKVVSALLSRTHLTEHISRTKIGIEGQVKLPKLKSGAGSEYNFRKGVELKY